MSKQQENVPKQKKDALKEDALKEDTLKDPYGVMNLAYSADMLATALSAIHGKKETKAAEVKTKPIALEPTTSEDNTLFPKLGKRKVQKPLSATTATSTETKNSCPRCDGKMRAAGVEQTCSGCGFIAPADVESEHVTVTGARLRIVGPNAGYYQPDLDRGSSVDTSVDMQKTIYDEFVKYRDEYLANHPKAIAPSLDACQQAAADYLHVQSQFTKRSTAKQEIMATLLSNACIKLGSAADSKCCVVKSTVVAEMMRLKKAGISGGMNFVNSMFSAKLIPVDININPCRALINTAFHSLGLEHPYYTTLADAAEKIVAICTSKGIAISSVQRTRAYGAVFTVLSRAPKNKFPPAPAAGGIITRGDIKPVNPRTLTFSQACDRWQNNHQTTIKAFLNTLNTYESHFKAIYANL
jgi:hypothetical protein